MHHAGRVIERLVVDDEARMRGGLEHLDELAERDVLLHRDDVGARHHDVLDPPLAQAQDVFEHRALVGREAGPTASPSSTTSRSERIDIGSSRKPRAAAA